jgi:hypothetical protein
MGGNLVAEEIEIDPVVGFAPDLAADDVAVKGAGGFFIIDGEGHMKWDHSLGLSCVVRSSKSRGSASGHGKKLTSWRMQASRIKIGLP